MRALLEKGISRHRGPRRTVFSSRSIQFPARTGVAFGLINTCRRCKQVFDPYICQERSGEWCGHGARNLLFQESIEDEASICFFSRKPSPSSSSSLPRRNSESVRKFLARAIVLTVFEWADRRFSAILEQATILQFLGRGKKIFAPSPSRTTREKSERRGGGGFRSVWKMEKVCNIICRFT